MSFLNKIKVKGQPDDDSPAPSAQRLSADGPATDVIGAAFTGERELPTQQQTREVDSSIISAAAPSELPDFSETRVPDDELAAAAASTGLPLIGKRPVAD